MLANVLHLSVIQSLLQWGSSHVMAIGSTVGVTLAVWVLSKVVSDDTLEAWGHRVGKAINVFGAGKFGLASWIKVRALLIDDGTAFFKGLMTEWVDQSEKENKGGGPTPVE